MKTGVQKAFVFLLTLAMLLPMTGRAYAEEELCFELISDSVRDVYLCAEDVTFIGRYTNTGNSPVEVDAAIRIINNSNDEVWSEEIRVSVGARTSLRRPISPQNLTSGFYTIAYTVSPSGGNAVTGSRAFYVKGGNGMDTDLGVCTHFSFANPVVTVEDVMLAKMMGASMIRDECWWGDVEIKRGVYSVPERISTAVDFAYENGIEILMPLTYSNALYCDKIEEGEYAGNWKMPYTDEQIAAYAAYCGYLAKTFKGKVQYFEVWNEVDNILFNYDIWKTGAATTYAKLLKAAYTAIKAENPDAIVVGFGACGASASTWYIQQTFDAFAAMGENCGNYMDVLGIHPYTWTEEPSDEQEHDYTYEIDSVVKLLDDYHVSVPIWATEIGYMKQGTIKANANDEPWSRTEERQAALDARAAVINKADGRVSKFFFYELQDNSAGGMGMITDSGVLKPAYYMYAALNERLSGTAYADECICSDADYKGYSVYRFIGEDKEVFVMWAKGGNTYDVRLSQSGAFSAQANEGSLNVNLSGENAGKQIVVYDAYGNITDDSIILDDKPIYVVCQRANMPACTVSIDGNLVNLVGNTGKAGIPVTVKAEDADGNAVYVDQMNSAEQGEYCFNFVIPSGKNCKIYLYDGNCIYTEECAYITIALYKNGQQIDEPFSLKANDEITAKATLREYRDGVLLGGLYGADGMMLKATAFDRIKNQSGAGEAEVTLKAAADGETVKFFLFDNKIKPLAEKKENRQKQ